MVSPFRPADMFNGGNGNKSVSELLQWQNDVFDRILQLNPKLTPSIRDSQRIPLRYLPIGEQIDQMKEYRRITGLNDYLLGLSTIQAPGDVPSQLIESLGESRARDVFNISHQLNTIKGFDSDAPYFKTGISYSPGQDPLRAIYSSMNLNFDTEVRDVRSGVRDSDLARNAASHFGIGVNSIRTVSPDYFNMSPNLRPGASFMSFDIETAGLMKGQIREVGYKTGSILQNGALGQGTSNQLLFSPLAGKRGTVGRKVGDRYNPMGLSEFLDSSATTPISDDFARSMVPFLESMKQSDYIVGHNISSFDLPQVFDQLTSTSAYRASGQHIIPGFRDLVDSAFHGIDAKIIDTLTLAQRSPNLSNIAVHRSLLALGDARPYSISNLLLQTDLGEQIGHAKLKELLKSGLHNASIDDIVTGSLLQHMGSLKLKPMTDAGMVNSILSSAAITPITNASVHSDISDRALRHLISNVNNGIYVPDEAKDFKDLIAKAQAGDREAAREAFKAIRSGTVNGLSFKINPIQQQVFETRNLGLGVKANSNLNFDPSSYIFRTNLYDQMAYNGIKGRRSYQDVILGQRGDISTDEFSAFQRQMAGMNMPFAGLSLEERRFGTSLAHLTGGINPNVASVSSLLSDTMISNFNMFEPGSVQYLTKSGRSSLPVSLLNETGDLKIGDLLEMSSVDRTIYGGKSGVNLVYKFDSSEAADTFATKLERLTGAGHNQIAKALGIDPDLFNEGAAEVVDPVKAFKDAMLNGLAEKIRSGGATKGVSIGQLYDSQARPVLHMLRQFHGSEELRDTSMLPMKLPFMSTHMIDPETGRGVVQTAGAVLDSGLTPSNLIDIGREASHAERVQNGWIALASDAKYSDELSAARMASGLGVGEEAAQHIKNVFEVIQKVRPQIPKVLGIAALAAFGMHEYNKRKENAPYNELFDRQEANSTRTYNVNYLLQQKMDAGINMSRQKYDPLTTGYVVDNLNSNKIGHTIMSSNKNTSLYGGVL